MKKRWLAALAPMAVLPLVLGSGAGAAPTWVTFGSGYAVGRGRPAGPSHEGLNHPVVLVESTTRRDPVVVRITLTDGAYTGKTSVITNVMCWNENDDWIPFGRWRISPEYVSLPKTYTYYPPPEYNFCWAEARGFPAEGDEPEDTWSYFRAGPLTVTMQATY
jgi:hypothetical protein